MIDEIKKRVLDILAEEICERVTEASEFSALKMDSLDYLGFIARVEEAFDVRIPGGAAAEFETPAGVIRWLEAETCA